MRFSAKNDGTSPSGDALGKTFNDSRLADAGLADQHGIVFRATAENLDDALDFVGPSNERVERGVDRGLRQVAAELGQQRTFLGAVREQLFRLRPRQFLANCRQP